MALPRTLDTFVISPTLPFPFCFLSWIQFLPMEPRMSSGLGWLFVGWQLGGVTAGMLVSSVQGVCLWGEAEAVVGRVWCRVAQCWGQRGGAGRGRLCPAVLAQVRSLSRAGVTLAAGAPIPPMWSLLTSGTRGEQEVVAAAAT